MNMPAAGYGFNFLPNRKGMLMHTNHYHRSKPYTPGLESARRFLQENAGSARDREAALEDLVRSLESRFVEATWTLRRLPDRERSFLSLSTMVWPDAISTAGDYAPNSMTSLQARRRARIDPKEIDRMQPTLDLLPLLPDITDRQLLFWTAWHQDGECQAKLPWAKVRRSLGLSLSRWTMKRRYENGLKWLAGMILMQQNSA